MNILPKSESINRLFITADQRRVAHIMHERHVIDPLFFGRSGEDPKVVQAEIDEADAVFRALMSNFEISNLLGGDE